MLTGIDHVVIAVADLEAAIKDYADLGFSVVRGGKHPRGSYNALIGFADGAYFEILGFYEPMSEHRWWSPTQRGGGVVDYCMGTDNLQADTGALRRAGADMSDPRQGARARPDGYQVRWVSSIPVAPFSRLIPFVIQDETPREERVPREKSHPNGATGIGTLTIVTRDTTTVRRLLAGVLPPGQDIVRQDLDASGVRFKIGSQTLDYVTPRSPAGPLHDWLQTEGPSPYSVTLTVAGAKPAALDPAKLRRARVSLA
jgi:catechol 2,3-dioxygenase-like lactoylglutathione lyase family enzyme